MWPTGRAVTHGSFLASNDTTAKHGDPTWLSQPTWFQVLLSLSRPFFPFNPFFLKNTKKYKIKLLTIKIYLPPCQKVGISRCHRGPQGSTVHCLSCWAILRCTTLMASYTYTPLAGDPVSFWLLDRTTQHVGIALPPSESWGSPMTRLDQAYARLARTTSASLCMTLPHGPAHIRVISFFVFFMFYLYICFFICFSSFYSQLFLNLKVFRNLDILPFLEI